MCPASMCLHHGLKAVFAPNAVLAPHVAYMERDWPAQFAEEVFNGGPNRQAGRHADNVFAEGPNVHEHVFEEIAFCYNSRFAERLWRRWLGFSGGGKAGRTRS